MGSEVSKLETDTNGFNRNFSAEHKISAWIGLPPKNADYYNGQRFFKVSKDHYRCYQKGYIYGHSYDAGADKELDDRDKSEIGDLEAEIAEIKRKISALAGHEQEF